MPASSAGGRSLALTVVAAQLGFCAAQLSSMALSRSVWPADLANFIRPHLLVAGLVLFAAGLVLPGRIARIAGLGALLAACLPYLLLPRPAEPAPGAPVSLVSANVLVDNRDPRPFLAIPEVARSDIVVLQEVRPPWQDALSASGLWPFESSRDLAANSDMKVFSRFPILDERRVSPESADTGGRSALRLELRVENRTLVLYAVHPSTPRSLRAWRERAAYLRDLERAVQAEPAGTAVVVAGDWNTPPWSPLHRDFLSATGYRTTEPRWWPRPTRFSIRLGSLTWAGTPIDRVVVSPALGLDGLEVGPAFGSNHLPVIARLTVPR